MSRPHVPEALRQRVADQAGHRCGYCLTHEQIGGYSMFLDHLVPVSSGGPTEEWNLWLACGECNHKSDRTHVPDPETGTIVPLFNPRRQRWADHFAWSGYPDRINALTAVGRATLHALHLNRPNLVAARRYWIIAGVHPPPG